jgi:hypothetical protein
MRYRYCNTQEKYRGISGINTCKKNEATAYKENYSIGSQHNHFCTRDKESPPPALNIAAAGQPETYILGRLCLQLKPVLVY